MIATLLLLLAAQVLPAPGSVQWELMTVEADGRTFIDPATIAREGDLVASLQRMAPAEADANGVAGMVVRVFVDCRRRTFAVQAADTYAQDGRYLQSFQLEARELQFEALGDTPGHNQAYARICGAPAPAR